MLSALTGATVHVCETIRLAAKFEVWFEAQSLGTSLICKFVDVPKDWLFLNQQVHGFPIGFVGGLPKDLWDNPL